MTLTLTLTWWNIAGLAIGLVLLFAWLWLYWPHASYLLWRASGGGWQARRSGGARTFADLHGLKPRHFFRAAVDRDLIVPLPVSDDEKVIIPREFSVSETGEGISLCVNLRCVFDVASRRVRRGCHGHYRLAKSLYYGKMFGGDPKCGGGQKYFFAPRLQRWVEECRLSLRVRHAFSSGVIRGVAVKYGQ